MSDSDGNEHTPPPAPPAAATRLPTMRPMVAIVGRPNVGKSAIFNRLVGRRLAIVHCESGVTRDRIIREVEYAGRRFDLVDTGGLSRMDGSASRDEIEQGIHRQAEAALSDATVVLLVADVTAGLTALDTEVARLIRRSGRPALLVANKCDNPGADAGADDFANLGLPVFPVSALHNRGFEPLMAAVLDRLPPPGEAAAEVEPLTVAIVGRPNVGKSSYINRLLHSDRVLVSAIPGTTRDSVDVPFTIGAGPEARHYLLIDTAGLRNPGKREADSMEYYGRLRAERSVRRADVVALLMDSETGPTAQDRRIAALIEEHHKGCVLVLSKWDLAPASEAECERAVRAMVPFMRYCPLVTVSAKTGWNMRKSIETLDTVAAQVRARLPTGVLNRVLINACDRVQRPTVDGRPLKVFYAVQTGVTPVRIRVFVNDPRRVPRPYTTYLARALRETFGLDGAPVELDFRARTRPPRNSSTSEEPEVQIRQGGQGRKRRPKSVRSETPS